MSINLKGDAQEGRYYKKMLCIYHFHVDTITQRTKRTRSVKRIIKVSNTAPGARDTIDPVILKTKECLIYNLEAASEHVN
jgi:hypothetical protein